MSGEIAWNFRRTAPGEVQGARDDSCSHRRQASRDQARILEFGNTHGCIEPFAYDVDKPVAIHDIELELRMLGCEFREGSGQMRDPKGQGRSEAKPAGDDIVAARYGIERFVKFSQDLQRPLVKLATGLGQRNAARRPAQEAHAGIGL